MAKTNEEFDRIFREKLEKHQEKPSALAWERLNHQLPEAKSSKRGIWWSVAASISILIVAGWMFWKNTSEINQGQLLAEEGKTIEELTSDLETPTSSENVEIPSTTESKVAQATKTQPTTTRPASEQPQINFNPQVEIQSASPNPEVEKTQSLIASLEQTTKELQVNIPSVSVEMNEVTLPVIQPSTIQQTVAEVIPAEEDAPLYRVNIYSDGIKKGTEPDKNLITEMGKTVGKVEGLLGKVDEGFADLQDKKNNLFTTLTSRK